MKQIFKVGDRVVRNPKIWPAKKWSGYAFNQGVIVEVDPVIAGLQSKGYRVRMDDDSKVFYAASELVKEKPATKLMSNGSELKIGDKVLCHNSGTLVVAGWTAPRHPGSTGRVRLNNLDGSLNGEFYPGVINAAIVPVARKVSEKDCSHVLLPLKQVGQRFLLDASGYRYECERCGMKLKVVSGRLKPAPTKCADCNCSYFDAVFDNPRECATCGHTHFPRTI
jgi:hypothetical protein